MPRSRSGSIARGDTLACKSPLAWRSSPTPRANTLIRSRALIPARMP